MEQNLEQKKSLLQILAESDRAYHELTQRIFANGGEISEADEAALEKVDVNLPEKVDGYAFVINQFQSASETFRQRAEEMRKVASSLSRAAERVKEGLKYAMHATGRTELIGDTVRYKLVATNKALVIDKTKLPAVYFMQVTETVPDKEKIKAALELGETVEGAHLEGGVALRQHLNTKGAER